MLLGIIQFVLLLAVPLLLVAVYERNAAKLKARRNGATATATATAAAAAAAAPQATMKEAVKPAEEARTEKMAQERLSAPATQKPHKEETPVAAAATRDTEQDTAAAPVRGPRAPRILITYASNSQTALSLSHKLFSTINSQLQTGTVKADSAALIPIVKILELREEDPRACSTDTLLEANAASDNYYSLIVFVVSTFTDGTAPPRSQAFEKMLKDCAEDHRVPRDALSSKRFALFGLGDIAYGEKNFNAFGKQLMAHCRSMGAPHFVVPPVYATEAKVSNLFQIFSQTLLRWLARAEFLPGGTVRVQKKVLPAAKKAEGCCKDEGNGATEACGCQSNSNRVKKSAAKDGSSGQEEGDDLSSGSSGGGGSDDDDGAGDSGLDEIEDLIDDITDDGSAALSTGPRELLNPRLRKNLEKQGYGLIGSHSGVKLCRWTKAMLRGRGGCYKHTFYNINSSQCMELTPSLACANKCIFCWRHHTNPVATAFKWKVDEPSLIVDQGIARHVKMINTMRGVPGVSEESLQNAFTVRHCALSLVGEPIMYPRINEFLHLLHTKRSPVSSFMVTNAQFPEQLRMLRPVTQLYLSIDAPTPEELKRIDRPLFEDYWDRCLGCVDVLRRKRNTRTVFRLTLVNEMNDANVANYADLVEKGWPDLIEVKGVTFCGTSHTNTINMKTNVPRHDEVIAFCARLCEEMARRKPNYVTAAMNEAAAASQQLTEDDDNGDAFTIIIPGEERNRPYHIACEHEHSCCVLVALDKFYFNKRWNTWIDYPKFFKLAARYEEVNGLPPVLDRTSAAVSADADQVQEAEEKFTFTSLDYCAPTPSWAVFRSVERGFDPAQTRVLGKKARPTAPEEDRGCLVDT